MIGDEWGWIWMAVNGSEWIWMAANAWKWPRIAGNVWIVFSLWLAIIDNHCNRWQSLAINWQWKQSGQSKIQLFPPWLVYFFYHNTLFNWHRVQTGTGTKKSDFADPMINTYWLKYNEVSELYWIQLNLMLENKNH
jgi:hypothetical protein